MSETKRRQNVWSARLENFNRWIENPRVLGAIAFVVIVLFVVRLFTRETPSELQTREMRTIRITSEPSGARIFIRDLDTGKITPAEITLDAKQLEDTAGVPFAVSVILPGYMGEAQQIPLAEDEMHFPLERAEKENP